MKRLRVLSAIIGIVLIVGTGEVVFSQTTVNPNPTGYYVGINGSATGPYDTAGLRQLISTGQLTRNSLVWKEGMLQWVLASTVKELEPLLSSAMPPALPTTPPPISHQQASYDGGSFELGGTFYTVINGSDSMLGGGINIAGVSYFNNIVGFGSYGNIIYYPSSNMVNIDIDALIGPSLKLLRTDQFSMPIAIGIWLNYAVSFGPLGLLNAFNVGAGANLTAEIKLAQKVHLYGRIQGAYGFLNGSVFIAPCIGIGF